MSDDSDSMYTLSEEERMAFSEEERMALREQYDVEFDETNSDDSEYLSNSKSDDSDETNSDDSEESSTTKSDDSESVSDSSDKITDKELQQREPDPPNPKEIDERLNPRNMSKSTNSDSNPEHSAVREHQSGYADYEDSKSDHELQVKGGYPENWDALRKQAYKRDDYKCQNCGVGGGPNGDVELHAHHIVPASVGGNHTLSNLSTLCATCHSLIHEHMD